MIHIVVLSELRKASSIKDLQNSCRLLGELRKLSHQCSVQFRTVRTKEDTLRELVKTAINHRLSSTATCNLPRVPGSLVLVLLSILSSLSK